MEALPIIQPATRSASAPSVAKPGNKGTYAFVKV
jgi:hypothetical protein